ncbi:MAG: Nif3-like dinuclear metal center hexameric protein [Bacteroidetes bacterium]|nr:MAG: Nif3-like dinuclear metal center hexameric protein [Bacteroidota bacterium]
MQIRELTNYLENIAPLQYQEGYDNSGLICGSWDMEIHGVLITLDSTEAIVEEAIQKGCNLIVAHHPIVFKGLKRFNGSNYVERTVIKALKNDIAIYAIHTNLDNVFIKGVNEKIAERLGLQATEILAPKAGVVDPDQPIGAGIIGKLKEPMEEMAFLTFLKNTMQTGCVRYTALRGKPISTVAVCGGSGSFLLRSALKAKADVFITGDFKYHEFFDAEGKLIIADIGHFESEQFTIELLYEIISGKFSNFALHCTEVMTNPIKYL